MTASPRSAPSSCGAASASGTFQTLVNPGPHHPARHHGAHRHHRTRWSCRAPTIETVLPSLLEFLGDAVIVGHNVRFDLGFLRAACERTDRTTPDGPPGRHGAPWPVVCSATRSATAGSARWPSSFGSTTSPATGRSTTRWPPATCCTCSSSGPAGSACSASTTCWACPRSTATPRPPSSSSPTSSPVGPASTSSGTGTAGRSTWARPPTCAPGSAATSPATVAGRWPSSCGRRSRIDHTVCDGPMEAAVLEVRLIAEWTPRFNKVGTRRGPTPT